MRIDVLTLFPRMFHGVFGESILKRATDQGRADFRIHDIRNFTDDRHRMVDDRPYGGGPGMVLKCEPIFRAVETIPVDSEVVTRRILLSPQGVPYDQAMAGELAGSDHLILLCGHYEGFDDRIRSGLGFEEVSIGDYVLTGGELPAMVLADSVVRLIPGVLGDLSSVDQESFQEDRLDHPHYTRPPEFRGMKVPEVLQSGNHEEIRRWRWAERERRTRERRPDLLDRSAAHPGVIVGEDERDDGS